MIKTLKNTTQSQIFISDTGQYIEASENFTIDSSQYTLYANSSSVISLIGDGTIVVSDGTSDLNISEGVNLIQDSYPKEVTTQKEKTDITLKMASGKKASNSSGYVELDVKVQGTPGSGDGRYVQGGTAWFLVHHPDDHFKVYIIDVDNIMGYGAGFQVGSYCDTGADAGFYAEPDGKVHVDSMGFFGFIPSGLYLRMIGQCGDGTADTIYMNIIWGKKG